MSCAPRGPTNHTQRWQVETPRQIAATADGHGQLEALIRDIEQRALGTPMADAWNFERLRLELGLTPPGSVIGLRLTSRLLFSRVGERDAQGVVAETLAHLIDGAMQCLALIEQAQLCAL